MHIYGMRITDNCGESCQSLSADYLAWQWPGIGRKLIIMAAQGCVWLFVVCILESDTLRRVERLVVNIACWKPDHGVPAAAAAADSDVADERERIDRTPVERLATTDAVILRQLTKFYGSFLAVNRLSVGIPQGAYVAGRACVTILEEC